MIDFPRHRGAGSSDFDWMQIKIASPDEIRSMFDEMWEAEREDLAAFVE